MMYFRLNFSLLDYIYPYKTMKILKWSTLIALMALMASCAGSKDTMSDEMPAESSTNEMNSSGTTAEATELLSANQMLIGSWDYVVKNTPQGDAKGVLTVTETDGVLAGEMYNAMLGQKVPVENMKLEGENLSFTVVFNVSGQNIPMAGKVAISADALNGELSVGHFGTFPVEATRAE